MLLCSDFLWTQGFFLIELYFVLSGWCTFIDQHKGYCCENNDQKLVLVLPHILKQKRSRWEKSHRIIWMSLGRRVCLFEQDLSVSCVLPLSDCQWLPSPITPPSRVPPSHASDAWRPIQGACEVFVLKGFVPTARTTDLSRRFQINNSTADTNVERNVYASAKLKWSIEIMQLRIGNGPISSFVQRQRRFCSHNNDIQILKTCMFCCLKD